jgi:hypothetical protein
VIQLLDGECECGTAIKKRAIRSAGVTGNQILDAMSAAVMPYRRRFNITTQRPEFS